MANEQNLTKPFTSDQSREEAAKNGRKGGIKSGEAKRARKTLREELLALLTENITSKDGRTMQTQAALSTALIKSALGGSVRAYEVIRDTIGEKPAENVTLSSGSFDALNAAFDALKDDAE